MDMGTSMNMAATKTGMVMGASSTAGAAAAATSKAAMSMSMGGGSSCKISMLWNWYTIDACFIARSWHITSKSMFAGSCIGVILLVMSLEFLRRASREYDNYIYRQYQKSLSPAPATTASSSNHSSSSLHPDPKGAATCEASVGVENGGVSGGVMGRGNGKFRPNLLQQMIRATFHMVQFTVAYFVMLLAMYYNGYIIISIIIGAWLGAFVFSWEGIGGYSKNGKDEATYCCG